VQLENLTIGGQTNGSSKIAGGILELRAKPKTDWFFNPSDLSRKDDVIVASTTVNSPVFSLSARLSVDFASPYDGGVIYVKASDDSWAKLAFEFSAERKPTIVSVVTRMISDDCDGPSHREDHVWLRIYCDAKTLAFHYSADGKYWRFIRWFSIPYIERRPIEIGFGAQSPTGEGSAARFADIRFGTATIENIRNGE
jgi:uncharacterized protein